MQIVLDELATGIAVSASLVWVRVLEGDHEQAARAAAQQLGHPLLSQFYDPQQRAARQMAARLGGAGHYAWDLYLVFAPGAAWGEQPPQPVDWAHQLDHAAWAPAERRRKGAALLEALKSMLAGD